MLNPAPPARAIKAYDDISGLSIAYREAGMAINIGPPVIRGGRRKVKVPLAGFGILGFFKTVFMMNLTAIRATMMPTTLPTSIRILMRYTPGSVVIVSTSSGLAISSDEGICTSPVYPDGLSGKVTAIFAKILIAPYITNPCCFIVE
jgi:hypothetical protein